MSFAASAILLFGSRARQDHERASDTDLLYICSEEHPRHLSFGRTSMFFYPWEKLLSDAANGDLFIGHIAHEARVVSDPQNQLGQLKAAFRFKSDYKKEIDHASDLGWFLIRFPEHLKPSLMAKRMIWCVRTTLIARLAEKGQLVFAPEKLAKLAESKAAKRLLSDRRRKVTDERMRTDFRKFLNTTTGRVRWHREASFDEFVGRFRESSNEVALKTLAQNEAFPNGIYA